MADRRTLVEAAVKVWTAQLVDLSGRNNLLYYRDLRTGTLELTPGAGVDRAVLAKVLEGDPVRLSALFPGDTLPAAAIRARRIRSKAKENFEERGLRTLMVGEGVATWTNPRSPTVPAAPVLLRPMTLTARGGAAEDFDLHAEDSLEVNPTLLHLLATEFAVRVDPEALLDTLEPPAEGAPVSAGAPEPSTTPPPVLAPGDRSVLYAALTTAASGVPGFAIAPRVVVGTFSYAKLPMVTDLAAAVEHLTAHDLIAAVAGDEGARAAVRQRRVTPDLVAPDRIDPGAEFLVLDSDASQTAVIAGTLAGADLVVEGPPGTGKSQTIANLIATLVANGRRILFVAEKRAAIDAVVNRLERVGLGDLVLDLHDGAGSRRKLAADLAKALADAAAIPVPDAAAAQDAVRRRRDQLAARTAALHEVRSPWGVSVYRVQAELLAAPAAVRVQTRLRGDAIQRLGAEERRQARDDLSSLVGLGGLSLPTGDSPWAGALTTGQAATAEQAQAALTAAATLLNTTLPAVGPMLVAAAGRSGLRPPGTMDGWASFLGLVSGVAATMSSFQPAIWDHPLDELAAAMAPATKGAFGRLLARLFSGGYRKARKALGALTVPGASAAPRALLAGVTAAAAQRRLWDTVRADAGPPRAPADLAAVAAGHERLVAEAGVLTAVLGADPLAQPEAGVADLLRRLVDDQATLFKLPEVHRLRGALAAIGLEPLLAELAARPGQSGADAAASLDFVWGASVLEAVSLADPRIGAFDGEAHRAAVAEFQRADKEHVALTAHRVRRACAEVMTTLRDQYPEESDVVERQARLKRRHMPVRDLFHAAPHVLGALKPCWAMSPLVVAQLLPPGVLFDVVVFDEASQITPADAVPALLRGRRAVVAGDAKQLPPTAFFVAAARDEEEDEADPAGAALTHDLESVLDVMAALLPAPEGTRTLAWHYRSRDERLIAFSNAQPALYDWQLTTFPGVSAASCLRHVLVPWQPGTDASESAAAEVDHVVELVREHGRDHPDETLGVIAMGITHADRIEEAIRRAAAADPVLDAFVADRPTEPFFVKNLERVQGDERDSIILSVGYGKTADGRLLHRFGPLNMAGGERRLNVAITRARSRMTVVSSFTAADLDESRLRAEGAKMLRAYLAYAESEGRDLGAVARLKPPLDGFERDVVARLAAAGVPAVAQHGESGRWVDVAVGHPSGDGRFVLAVEADGPGYGAIPTARDRDRLRAEHLGRLGWAHHRVWSSAWFRDPDAEVARIVAAWRAAAADADAEPAAAAPPPAARVSSSDAGRSLPRPRITRGQPIDEYTHAQLVELVRWIESDTLLRTTEELQDAVIEELGFKRRGTRIVAAVDAAIAAARA